MIEFRYRRFVSSIAMLAMLVAAFAPTLTHAFFGKSNAPWQALCTAQGIKQLGAGSLENQSVPKQSIPQQNSGNHFDKCPYCGSHANGTAIINTGIAQVFLIETVVLAGSAYLSPVIADYTQVSHPSQAPPVA